PRRGRIEALSSQTKQPLGSKQSPRRPRRGRIEASPDKLRTRPPGNLHGVRAVAELKRRDRRQLDPRRLYLHGVRAVAELKRPGAKRQARPRSPSSPRRPRRGRIEALYRKA